MMETKIKITQDLCPNIHNQELSNASYNSVWWNQVSRIIA